LVKSARRCAFTALAAAASSGITSTCTPAFRSRTAPPPGTKTGGSRQAITTRRMPLAMIRSAHGTGLDALAAQGSSELYKVAPTRNVSRPDPATLARATSSA
jgi:hypothetical protein